MLIAAWMTLTVLVLTSETNALFSVYPANPVTQRGLPTELTCLSNGNQIIWTVQYLDSNEACEILYNSNKYTTLPNCRQQTRYMVAFNAGYDRHRNRNQGLLTIADTQLDDAGTYSCIYVNDRSQRGQASLTVLDEAPSGEYTPKYVISGNNVTYTCRVSYNSSNFLKMSWNKTGTGRMVSPAEDGVRLGSKLLATGDHGHNTLIRQESTLTIAVRPNVLNLDPFTCSVYASAPVDVEQPPTNQRSYTWNSSSIVISYCPNKVAIRSSTYPPKVGSQLTCQADAHPPAVFRWMAKGGAGHVSGNGNGVLTVTSLTDDVIEFRCMAMNFLGGMKNENPCYASTSITMYKRDVDDELHDVDVDDDNRQVASQVSPLSSVTVPTAVFGVLSNSSTLSTLNIRVSVTPGPDRVHLPVHSDITPQTAGPMWHDGRSSLFGSDASSMNDNRANENSAHHQGVLVMTSLMLACVLLAVGVVAFIVVRKHAQQSRDSRMIASTRYIADRQELDTTASMTTEMSLANE